MITISDTGHTLNNPISFYAPSRESKSTPVSGKSFVTSPHPLLHARARASETYRTLVHSLWLDFHSRPSSHGSGEIGESSFYGISFILSTIWIARFVATTARK